MADSDDNASDPRGERIGTVVSKYTIVRLLGAGGMGTVYEARHAKLARRFAIKFLQPELVKNPEILRRFENEARAAGGLEHPNLAAVTDVGRAKDGAPYLVMEFLAGEDCGRLLQRSGPLPAERAANIVLQACRGLVVAHKSGIVHRDLKPENLFLTDAGDGSDLVKVLDFGIAKLRSVQGAKVTGTGTTFGTANYMSPEQARGASDIDERTDVWSLGVVLYELLSGRKPFEGEQFLQVIHQILSVDPVPLATLRPGLPPGLVAAIRRAMEKETSRRTPTVSALAQAVAPFAGRLPAGKVAAPSAVPTAPTPVTAVSRSPALGVSGRRVTKAGAAIAALILVAVAGAVMAKRSRREPAAAPTPALGTSAPAATATPPPPGRSTSELSEQSSNTPARPKPADPPSRREAQGNGAAASRSSAHRLGKRGSGSNERADRGVSIDPSNPY